VSTVIEILKATEEVLLPDGRRILAAALERVVDADRGVISGASSRGDASSRGASSRSCTKHRQCAWRYADHPQFLRPAQCARRGSWVAGEAYSIEALSSP
jgi:hypothetical protein